jgi:predicted nucleic acid-binding Zn ribbon protein
VIITTKSVKVPELYLPRNPSKLTFQFTIEALAVSGMAMEGLNTLITKLEGQTSWQARRQFRKIVEYWPKSVGYAVARQTRPISLQRQVLQVATSTSAWAQTLMMERPRILKKLNHYLPTPVKEIRFSTAQWSMNAINTNTRVGMQLFSNHPSYIGSQTEVNTQESNTSKKLTPYEAFEIWSTRIQAQQKHQSICPACKCPCPIGEIERWDICALCATKNWS